MHFVTYLYLFIHGLLAVAIFNKIKFCMSIQCCSFCHMLVKHTVFVTLIREWKNCYMWISICIYLMYNVFPNCCSYFFQHFSWEFLIIGIRISALLSALIQLKWVSLLSAWSSLFLLLASVYAIHQSMSYDKLKSIFMHHFIDLIYGNCFAC